jgi:hypothetical protein
MILMPFLDEVSRQKRNLPEIVHHFGTAPLGFGIAAAEVGPERRRDDADGADGMAEDVVVARRWRFADVPIGAAVPVVIAWDIDHSVEPIAQAIDDGAVNVAAAIGARIARQQQHGFAVFVARRQKAVHGLGRAMEVFRPKLGMDVGDQPEHGLGGIDLSIMRALPSLSFAGSPALRPPNQGGKLPACKNSEFVV